MGPPVMAPGETGAAATPPKAVALLGFCAVLLLGRGVRADDGKSSLPDTDKRTPGSKNYCVTLSRLSVSEGKFTPAFESDHEEYTLEVENSQSLGVVFTIGLDLQQYNLQHTPVILVDGEKLDYIPTEAITVRIPLDGDIGAFDKVIPVEVKDPAKGSWFTRTNSKTYKVHITQGPEFDKVTRAEELELYGGGAEITSEPAFDPNSSASDYFFNVSSWVTSVELQFRCNEHATKMMLDGTWQEVKKHHHKEEEEDLTGLMKKTIDLESRVLQRVPAACSYHKDHWKNERDYLITIARDVRMTDKTKVDLKLMPETGFCMPRRDYMREVRKVNLPKGVPSGFVCLTSTDSPRMIVDCNEEHAQITLRSEDWSFQGRMQNFVPLVVFGAKSRGPEYTMVVTLGSDKRELPVEILFPAPCSTMQCPRHYGPKYIPPEAPMIKKLCLGKQCTEEEDTDTCCDKLASCTTYECKNNRNSSSYYCAGTKCTKEADDLHCCQHWQRCLSFDCPYGYHQRLDASTTYCSLKVCPVTDVNKCCIKQASCGDQSCPKGSTMGWGKNQSSDQHCLMESCSNEDSTHCCEPVGHCLQFKCPKGFKKRKDADKLTCYTKPCVQTDTSRCCVPLHIFDDSNGGIVELEGKVREVNTDGTYVVVFLDNTTEMQVPEWSMQNPETMKLTIRPGERVTVFKDQDGNYLTHTAWSGWVHRVHTDGTYLIHFVNNQWVDRIPQWAVRAVDNEGKRFVYSTAAFLGQLVYVGRTSSGTFKSVETAIAQVEAVHEDDKTYDVRFASGHRDEHVPLWDLRLVDSNGISHVQTHFKVDDVVEVDLLDLDLKDKFDDSHRHDMMLRTKYLFGTVSSVREDNLYGVTYDFGETEDNVPLWAIRALNDQGVGEVKAALAIGERVEARVGLSVADRLAKHGIATLGIALREKLHHYKAAGCYPQPQECRPKQKKAPLIDGTVEQMPNLTDYDVVKNPKGLQLCYYDEICAQNPGASGCNASQLGCRRCGFDGNPACPSFFDCSGGKKAAKAWPKDRKDWCCEHYRIGCPYVCRFGKWWPDEVNAWGPWWSTEKREWCCKTQNVGCPRSDLNSHLFTTTGQTTGTTSTPPIVCNDGLEAEPVEPGDCPSEKEAADLEPCSTAAVSSLCQGDDLCGGKDMDNCGDADVFLKKVRRCPNDEGIKGFRFSHPGYWATGAVFSGKTDSREDCAKICSKHELCVAFSRHQFLHNCFTYAELGQRVLGSPSDAYLKCDDSKKDSKKQGSESGEEESDDDEVDLQVKYGPNGRSKQTLWLTAQTPQSRAPGAWMTLLFASSAAATLTALLFWGLRLRHADAWMSQRATFAPLCFGDGSGGSQSVAAGLVKALCGDEERRGWGEGDAEQFPHSVKLQALQQDDL